MRLTFLADLRSPIAVQWIRFFIERGHAIQAISSYPISDDVLPGAETTSLSLVLAGPRRDGASGRQPMASARRRSMQGWAAEWASPQRVTAVRNFLGPALVRTKGGRLQRLVERHQPDLVHAMRIPFEGVAAAALVGPPKIVSVWGNDFTLQASRSRITGKATRRALATVDLLHCDCHRDAQLAPGLGFPWRSPDLGGTRKWRRRPVRLPPGGKRVPSQPRPA